MGIYEQFGVRRIVNATCHWTGYGGTVMWPEVVDAMADARRSCVDMSQLLDRAGEFICRYTHAEASLVTSGCAAGLTVGAAAILTRGDRFAMAALPHTSGLMRNQFVARRFARTQDAAGREVCHWGYAHAVRGAGGVFVEAGGPGGATREEFVAAFGPDTAGVYWVSDGVEPGIQLAEVIAVAHDHGVPVLVDASNTLPPPEHLYSLVDLGADLVAFSGGKGLRGPQGSGILTGRGDLIRAGRMLCAPNAGICRPMKVSKEEIVGLLTALEIWAARDHEADMREAVRRTRLVVNSLAGFAGARAEYRFPDHIGRPYPTVFIHLDPTGGLTAGGVIKAMLDGEPSVAIMGYDQQTVRADVRILTDDEAMTVAQRLRDVLSSKG